MRTIFNFLWSITLWLILWILYMWLSFIFSITVVLDPIWKSMRQIAKIILWPFWKSVIRDKNQSTYNKRFGLIFNIIWFPFWIFLWFLHTIFWIISCFTIVWIPTWLVMFKIAKAIVFPIWIKVVNQKELVQEMVREELQKQWELNQNQEINNHNNVENSSNENIPVEEELNTNNWKIKQIPLKKWDTSVSISEALKPFMFLKPVALVLLFIQQLFLTLFVMDEFTVILGVIFLSLSILQIVIYILIKFNLSNKVLWLIQSKKIKDINIEFLFLAIIFLFLILVNGSFLVSFVYVTLTWDFSFLLVLMFIVLNLSFLHLYYLINYYYNKNWKIDWIIKELDKYDKYEFVKKINIFLENKFINKAD